MKATNGLTIRHLAIPQHMYSTTCGTTAVVEVGGEQQVLNMKRQ